MSPLVVFRILFGLLMFIAVVRFWSNGWIHELFVMPRMHFHYHGFEWVTNPGAPYIYWMFAGLGITSLCIAFGFLYRIASIVFFLTFTYIELIDATNYLNHYYFVSIVGFLMIWLPAHRDFSLDVRLGITKPLKVVPQWMKLALMLQLGMVYFFAGIAKINADWLFHAQPITVWLAPKYDLPVLGWFIQQKWFLFAMAWFGLLYDLSVPFLLSFRKTRWFGYGLVLIFHVFTAIFFPIGMFPYMMMLLTFIFFSPSFHHRIVGSLKKLFNYRPTTTPSMRTNYKLVAGVFTVFLFVQALLPFRYLLNDGDLFWHEKDFRFSWRVMLMEKYGTGTFYIQAEGYPGKVPVCNSDFLSPQQEKMVMSQPDLILQYADFLKQEYAGKVVIERGDTIVIQNPSVFADIDVTLNGRPHQKFVDPNTELTALTDGFHDRSWLEPAPKE